MRCRASPAVLGPVAVAALISGCAVSRSGVALPGHAASPPAASASARSTPAPRGLAAAPVPAASLPVSLPTAASVSYADPTAVSRAAVIIQWTMDTVTDASQYQAELRSAPFLAPGYLAQLRANPPVAAPGYQWDQWAAHHAYTTVSLVAEPDEQPPDTVTTAYRQWGITVTPHGTGGWTGAPQAATVFVQLSRAGSGQPWLVSAVSVDPS
jgi:hypothetical protein